MSQDRKSSISFLMTATALIITVDVHEHDGIPSEDAPDKVVLTSSVGAFIRKASAPGSPLVTGNGASVVYNLTDGTTKKFNGFDDPSKNQQEAELSFIRENRAKFGTVVYTFPLKAQEVIDKEREEAASDPLAGLARMLAGE